MFGKEWKGEINIFFCLGRVVIGVRVIRWERIWLEYESFVKGNRGVDKVSIEGYG